MAALTALALTVASGFALYLILRAGFAALEQSGREAERAKRAQRDLEIAKAQAEVMAESRTTGDAEQRLLKGNF